jgi:hypothetical protein
LLKDLYAITINTIVLSIVLFLVINVALVVLFFVKGQFSAGFYGHTEGVLFEPTGAPIENGKRTHYQKTWFDYSAYEGIADQAYAGTVLDDFTGMEKLGFIYQPWVQFSEAPYEGKLVHVDIDAHELPLRRTENRSPEKATLRRILVLGGSTTFGYNVSDEHTWPSHLSAVLNERAARLGLELRIEVANYGRSSG